MKLSLFLYHMVPLCISNFVFSLWLGLSIFLVLSKFYSTISLISLINILYNQWWFFIVVFLFENCIAYWFVSDVDDTISLVLSMSSIHTHLPSTEGFCLQTWLCTPIFPSYLYLSTKFGGYKNAYGIPLNDVIEQPDFLNWTGVGGTEVAFTFKINIHQMA